MAGLLCYALWLHKYDLRDRRHTTRSKLIAIENKRAASQYVLMRSFPGRDYSTYHRSALRVYTTHELRYVNPRPPGETTWADVRTSYQCVH